MKLYPVMVLLIATAAGGHALAAEKAQAGKAVENEPAPMVMLVPVEISVPALKSGCWAQLYEERNFSGDVFTIAGPIQLESASKSAGRHFRSNLESLVIGPKATLTVFERSMFKDKSVKFGPNSKEGGLVKKLGFGGRIESLKLECSS